MNAFPLKFLACLVAGMAAAAISVPAQSAIQFSMPAGTDKATDSEDLQDPLQTRKLSVNDYNAPVSIFGKYDPARSFDPLPGGLAPGVDSAANARKWKQFLEGKQNWALMTPEQILGVQTPEQVLGIANPKDNNPDISMEERYLLRQSSLASTSATNGFSRFSSVSQPDSTSGLFGRRDEPPGSQKADGWLEGYGTKRLNPASGFMGNSSPFGADQRNSFGGANPFGLPAPAVKASPDQLAGMNRFRALLDSGSAAEKPAVTTSFSPVPAAHPSSLFEGSPNLFSQPQPLANPVGHSFRPLISDAGQPMGITPLPSLTRPTPPAAKVSATQAKLPPWMSDSYQPFKRF